MDLISIIIIIVIISKVVKKKQAEQDRIKKNTAVQNVWDQVAGQVKSGQNQARSYSDSQSRRSSSSENDQWKKLARENIEKAKTRASEKLRAKSNADANKVDVTLHSMEAEQNHSERVAPAEHHHPEDVMPESMLGSIEDLMIKGYDGNLCFERDFIGEAMDMISRFTVPSDVPDFSKDDVA